MHELAGLYVEEFDRAVCCAGGQKVTVWVEREACEFCANVRTSQDRTVNRADLPESVYICVSTFSFESSYNT